MRLHSLSPSTTSRRSAVLWSGVPVLAAVTGVLGLRWSAQLSAAGALDAQELSLAVTAAAACLAVAAWWLGGLVMAGVALVAHRLRWRGAERWARRLTPALIARTTAALVGVQLATVVPAHAADASVDPFWGPPTTGTEQLAPVDDVVPAPGDAAVQPSVPPAPQPESATAAPGNPGARTETPDSPGFPHSPHAPRSTTHAPLPTHAPAPERVVDGSLTVVRGDTLWDLTEQLLGARATDEDVCRHLGSWAELNVLEADGDLIRPGQQLRVPPQLLGSAGVPG